MSNPEPADSSRIKEELRATLAKNIISARKAKAKVLGRTYTQEQLADDSGHSTTAIAQIERGEVDPRLSTIAGIAVALNVNPVFLLFGRSEIELLYQMIRDLDEQSLSEISDKLFSENWNEIEQLANSSIPKHRVKASQISAATMALRLNKQLAQNAMDAAEAGQQIAESAIDVMDESMKLGMSTSVGIGAAMAGIMGATVGAFMGISDQKVSDLFREATSERRTEKTDKE
jgi:transcriptional regulator with XRE-family HTH domain